MPPEVVLHRQWYQVVSIKTSLNMSVTHPTYLPGGRVGRGRDRALAVVRHASLHIHTQIHQHPITCNEPCHRVPYWFRLPEAHNALITPHDPITASKVRQDPLRGQHAQHGADTAQSPRKDRRERLQPRRASGCHGHLEHASQPYVTRQPRRYIYSATVFTPARGCRPGPRVCGGVVDDRTCAAPLRENSAHIAVCHAHVPRDLA